MEYKSIALGLIVLLGTGCGPSRQSFVKAAESQSTGSYSSNDYDYDRRCYVKGHYRNGKWVQPYYRSCN